MPVGNKINHATEEEFLRHEVQASGEKVVATIPYDVNIVRAEISCTALLEFAPEVLTSVKVIEDLKQTLIHGAAKTWQ